MSEPLKICMDDTNPTAPWGRTDGKRRGDDERELLLRFRDGDPDAFALLVAEYRAPVYAYLVRCNVADGERDDLFQDIFIRIHRSAAQYRAERPLHPWLFTIVANAVRTYHRKRRLREIVFTEPVAKEPADTRSDTEKTAAARQTAAWLESEIRQLPLAQQEVLILTCVENLPQKDVADALGMPLNTLKTHLRRARLSLMRKLTARNAVDAASAASTSGDEVTS